MKHIYLVGKAGSGKDTIADYLCNKYGYKQLRFAKGVYDYAYKYFNMSPSEKDRQLLQGIGKCFREEVDINYWLNMVGKQLAETKQPCVITDCRFINEHNYLKGRGVIGVGIDVKHDIRLNRLISRDGSTQIKTLNDVSEIEMDTYFKELDYFVDNSDTIDSLYLGLNNLINTINRK